MCTEFGIYVVRTSSSFLGAIYSEHGSKVGKEFNALLISLKHLITLQTAMAMQGKNPMCNYCGFQ